VPLQKFDSAAAWFAENQRSIGRSENTINNYETAICKFREFWSEHAPEQNPSFSCMKAWRDSMLLEGRKPSTVRQYLVLLGGFFSAVSDPSLEEQRFYESSPVSKRLLPDITKENRRPYDEILSDEQAALLWRNECPKGIRKSTWARDYAIVVLLLSTEIRNTELLQLTPADIDFNYSELTVEHGKGNRYRVVDMPDIAVSALRLYLQSGIRPAHLGDDAPLFGTYDEFGAFRQGSRSWATHLVEHHVRVVTGISHVTSHDLRHVGARLDLNNGMRMEELQAKLGHSSMNTTQIYSGRLTQKRRRESAKACYAERDRQAEYNFSLLNR
jgi:site-specific recombinase XerD